MPREGGVFDPRTDKEAFDEGRRERESGAQKESDQFFSRASHTIPDIALNQDSRSSQQRAYDAGHESTTRRYSSSSGSRSSSSSRSRPSSYSGSGGGGGGVETSEGGGILFFGIVVGAIGGLLYGMYYAGGRMVEIKNPSNYGWDLMCGFPILGLVLGTIILGSLGAILEWLRGSFK